MNWNFDTRDDRERLEELTTEQLLSFVNISRGVVARREDDLESAKQELKYAKEHFFLLKDILKDRPHVPNKQERKVIRQEKAKAKKNR